jgi:aspartate/methionine/tyrosine aminotransferase
MYGRTVTINGFSKGPAMTGFRLGYLAAPTALATACNKLQSQNTSSPSSISQHAGIAALTAPSSWLESATAGYRQKRDYTLKRLRAMPGVRHPYEPQGAFYVFPTVTELFGKTTPSGKLLRDAEGVCLYFLEECLVALVPGEAFGDPRCLRISYATSMEIITTAMDRMEAGIKALH